MYTRPVTVANITSFAVYFSLSLSHHTYSHIKTSKDFANNMKKNKQTKLVQKPFNRFNK